MVEKDNRIRCGVCKIPCFERNNYFYNKLMTVRDFQAEQCYFNEKRWLINRMINGWGVVCGLDVKGEPVDPNDISKGYDDKKVWVTPGLAIDCCGREILVCKKQEVLLKPKESQCHKEQVEQEQEKKLIVCLEFYECKTEPISIPPMACDQKEKCEFNRIRDSFKISIRSQSEIYIKDTCEKLCPLEDKSKNIHGYLCEELKEGCKCPGCPEWPCLVLAEITITPSAYSQDSPTIKIDQCSKRKLVYSNPLLYDLINCFHGVLPHVIEVNWKENGATIPWDEFKNGIYEDGVQVKFDKRMDTNTINKNTFLFLVRMEDADTGNYRYDQVPGEVSYDEDELTATFEIKSEWLVDVYLGYSRAREKGGEFMVILRSDFILSTTENGRPAKALDGNFIGGKLPSGNGTQGGDFVSWFYVGPKPPEEEREQKKRR